VIEPRREVIPRGAVFFSCDRRGRSSPRRVQSFE